MNNSIINTSLLIFSGILLFLFSLEQIRINLNYLFSSKLQLLISKFVNTKFKSFVFGALSSAIIQSSSGITAIAISLLSSKYIKEEECLGIIIGANLGTCLTTFIVAINLNNLFLCFITVGIILFFVFPKHKNIFVLIIYLGLMLTGLKILNQGFDNIINNKNIYDFIYNVQSSKLLSLLFGIFSTAIIQSSSGIISIVEEMYYTKIINIFSSIFIMLGANIGTTLTGYITTINTKNNTRKIIHINVLFNILGVLVFIFLCNPFIKHIINIENNFFSQNIKLSIAYAHFIFNFVSVILGYIFFNFFCSLINNNKDFIDKKIKNDIIHT